MTDELSDDRREVMPELRQARLELEKILKDALEKAHGAAYGDLIDVLEREYERAGGGQYTAGWNAGYGKAVKDMDAARGRAPGPDAYKALRLQQDSDWGRLSERVDSLADRVCTLEEEILAVEVDHKGLRETFDDFCRRLEKLEAGAEDEKSARKQLERLRKDVNARLRGEKP